MTELIQASVAGVENEREWRLRIGANPEQGGVRFRVWAPAARHVAVVLHGTHGDDEQALEPAGDGYYERLIDDVKPGARYKLRIDGELFPDPASRAQPDGVHGWSEVVDPAAFDWSDDAWAGIKSDGLVIYELHVGTFTPQGTFDGAIERLEYLAELGVSAIEVMPIASFSGSRNWGYDGVNLYAPDASYGGPEAFKRFVNAAHRRGLGVILDVVYNHFGPDGNYLPAITGGRLFNDQHKTPWGSAINYDGADSAPVRELVVQNTLYWAIEYHVDGLRLDAAHAILDESRVHILQEIADRLHHLERPRLVIAEDERNERRLVLPSDRGGLGLDAVWADDFHHEVRRMVAGDSEGYFSSYNGTIEELVATMRKGWLYEGQWSAHMGAARGTPAHGLPPRAFVHCIQNHDQVGNRPMGDRLHHRISPAEYRAVSALLLLAPYTPMLWMGQEWAASSPFQYFTDHPEELGKLVTKGRREEFKHFAGFSDPELRARIPDPQLETTFTASKLRWHEIEEPEHRGVLELYRTLLALRRSHAALRDTTRDSFAVDAISTNGLALQRGIGGDEPLLILVNLCAGDPISLERAPGDVAGGSKWRYMLSTEEERFGGAGQHGAGNGSDAAIELRGPGALVFRAAR